MFNGPPAGQVYSPGMKLGAIAGNYSTEESSSNEDCDDDSFNFKDIPLR